MQPREAVQPSGVGYRAAVTVPLPRGPRIAAPAFHRSMGFDVLALAALAFLALFVPGGTLGGALFLACVGGAVVVMRRRRSMGAYEDDDGLVIRNYLRTHVLAWPRASKAAVHRDPILPWLKVGAVDLLDGAIAPVTALRHAGRPPDELMVLTRIVRERREGLSRETWGD
jgi:hypothetical protein